MLWPSLEWNHGAEWAAKPLLSVISLHLRSYSLMACWAGFRGSGVTNWTAIRRRSPMLSILQTRPMRLKHSVPNEISESKRGTLKLVITALPGSGQLSAVEQMNAMPVEETSTIRPLEGVSLTPCANCTGQRHRSLRSLLCSPVLTVIGAPTSTCQALRHLLLLVIFDGQ